MWNSYEILLASSVYVKVFDSRWVQGVYVYALWEVTSAFEMHILCQNKFGGRVVWYEVV